MVLRATKDEFGPADMLDRGRIGRTEDEVAGRIGFAEQAVGAGGDFGRRGGGINFEFSRFVVFAAASDEAMGDEKFRGRTGDDCDGGAS